MRAGMQNLKGAVESGLERLEPAMALDKAMDRPDQCDYKAKHYEVQTTSVSSRG